MPIYSRLYSRQPKGFSLAEAIIALSIIVILSGAAVINFTGLIGRGSTIETTNPRQLLSINNRVRALEQAFYLYAGIKGCLPTALLTNGTISSGSGCGNDSALWQRLYNPPVDAENVTVEFRNYLRINDIIKPGYDGTSAPGLVQFEVFVTIEGSATLLSTKTLVVNG